MSLFCSYDEGATENIEWPLNLGWNVDVAMRDMMSNMRICENQFCVDFDVDLFRPHPL